MPARKECGLTEIPASWAALVNLHILDLSDNPLSKLPPMEFPELRELALADTDVSLPDLLAFVARCPRLVALNVRSATLPDYDVSVKKIAAQFPALKIDSYEPYTRPSYDTGAAVDAAAQRGELVNFLIEAGARDDDAIPAAKLGYTDVVTALLDRGAPLEGRDREGWTPLLAACGGGGDTAEVLVERGADLTARDGAGRGAIWHALDAGNEQLARWLLDHGAPVGGVSPLALAIARGDRALFEALLAHGADFGDALHAATEAGSLPILRRLLAAGAPVDGRDAQGNTALRMAVHWRQAEMFEVLVAAGADVNAASPTGNGPLTTAVWARGDALVARLLELGAVVTDQAEDAATRSTPEIRALLAKARAMQGPAIPPSREP